MIQFFVGQLTGILELSRPQPTNSCKRTVGWWFWRVILILEDPSCGCKSKLAYPIYGDYQWLSLSVTWESPFTNHQQAVFEQVLLPLGSTYQCGTPKNHGWSSSKSHVAVLSEGNKQCTVFGSCCHDYAEKCAKHATCKAYGCGTYRRFHACQWRMVGMMREWRELGSM